MPQVRHRTLHHQRKSRSRIRSLEYEFWTCSVPVESRALYPAIVSLGSSIHFYAGFAARRDVRLYTERYRKTHPTIDFIGRACIPDLPAHGEMASGSGKGC